MEESGFIPPDFWSFPPFFTIQPVQTTRQKQLDLWKDMLLEYHMKRNIHTMTVSEFPYFENNTINRKLNREGILAVINHMVASGNAEWEDGNYSRVRIIWKTPEALGAEIYTWAKSNAYIGSIFTIYELLNNDEYADSGFHSADPYLFKKAIESLQRQEKAVLIEGANSEEDGVKFL